MKKLMIIGFTVFALMLSGCSKNKQSNLGFINAIANFKLVSKQDEKVNSLYQKYSPLLNEVERNKAESAYAAIKKAGEKPSLKTPVNYFVAKNSYLEVVPMYHKYKGEIDENDQVVIVGIHEKLKSISLAIDKAIEGSVKDELTLEYIKTATLLIGAFS